MSKYDNLILGFGQGAGTGDGKLFVLKPTDGNGDFTVVRADSKYVDIDGVITEVPANYPSMPTKDGGCPTLLCEGAATNLALWSEDFSNAVWTKSNTTVTSNVTTAPNGTMTASKLERTATNSYIRQSQTFTGDNSVYFFVKKDTLTWCQVYLGGNIAYFDLGNGVKGSASGTTYVSHSIVSIGDGWYRCSITTTYNLASTIRIYGADDDLDVSGTTGSIYVWGCQSETGAPTSYIKSEGTNGTRAADVIDGAQADFDDNIGVIEIDMQALANSGTDRSISINDGTSAERIEIRLGSTDNNIECYFVHLSSFNNLSYNVKDATEMNNVKILYNGTTAKLKINDVQVDQREDREVSVGLSTCDFKIGAASNLFEGYLQKLNVYSDTSAFASTATTFNAMATTAKYDLK